MESELNYNETSHLIERVELEIDWSLLHFFLHPNIGETRNNNDDYWDDYKSFFDCENEEKRNKPI